jgi:hypothetical protein
MITYTKLPIEEIEYLDRPQFHKEEIKFKESLLAFNEKTRYD